MTAVRRLAARFAAELGALGALCLLCVLLCVAAACSLRVNYDGTSYQCPDGTSCPIGYDCVANMCVRPLVDPDAALTVPDAPVGGADARADAMSPIAGPPWWDTAWTHRRQLIVHNNSTTDVVPETFQVGWEMNVDALLQAGMPWDSIRVVHWNPGSGQWLEMTRVIQETAIGDTEHVWIGLWDPIAPAGVVDHYWLYYDNAAAGPADNDPRDIMEAYFPFSAFDAALEIEGAATVTGGDVQLDQNEDIGTIDTWGPNYAVDLQLRAPAWGSRIWGGFQVAGSFLDDQPWAIWITRSPNTGMIWPEFIADDAGVNPEWTGTLAPLEPGVNVNFTVERYPKRITYLKEFQAIGSFDLPMTFTAPMRARLTNESANPVFFDMMQIRQAMDPAPTVEVGAEENAP